MKKGFTLLELLIVIGIIAILAATVFVVINPVEVFRKGRDSARITDLNSLKLAIGYYTTETATPSIGSAVAAKTYSDVVDVTCGSTASSTIVTLGVDGTGWIPIIFSGLSGGSPIASLPRDPAQSALATTNPAHYYVYLVRSTTDYTYELVANMESTYYKTGGDGDVETNDGGTNNHLYEVGTDLSTAVSTGSACFAGDGA